MLVLTRKDQEEITIGPITIKVLAIDGNQVRLGIDAPRECRILRGELEPTVAGSGVNQARMPFASTGGTA